MQLCLLCTGNMLTGKKSGKHEKYLLDNSHYICFGGLCELRCHQNEHNKICVMVNVISTGERAAVER
jgi:hypothetical protein